MSSERLEACEEELKALLEDLQSTVSYQLPTKYGEDRRRTLNTVDRKLKEAEMLLRDIQTELWKSPSSYQQQASSRVAQYKGDLASLRRQLTTSGLREELFAREEEEEEIDDLQRGERELLLKNTETLQRASKSLHRAQQVSAQTDGIAVGIMEDLDDQKASLIRTRDKVSGIDSEMDRTRSLLRTIACKTIQNRVILIAVILLELIILAIVVYIKFFS